MAALAAVVNSNTAWQKVNHALTDANPATQEAFRALKIYLANQKLNLPLNIAFFTQADATVAATGTVLGTGAPTVYAIYAKKGTVATNAWLKVSDDATGGAATGTTRVAFPFTGAGDEKFFIDPEGLPFTLGIAVMSNTSFVGITVSTGASTAMDGFVIYSV